MRICKRSTTWYEIPTGVDNKLNTIDFPSINVGYIGGNDTLLLKTTDGGENWSEIDFAGVTVFPGGEDILDINFVDDNIGYLTVGPYGGTFKTSDGGFNWAPLATMGSCYNQTNFFFAEDDGFIGGSGCFTAEEIEIVSSGPAAFAMLETDFTGGSNIITQIDFLDSDFGMASSSGGQIFRTTDGGVNWDTIPSSLHDSIPITSMNIIDDTLAYAGYDANGGGFGILMSTDAGLTWAEDMNSATFYYPAFYEVVQSNHQRTYVAAVPSGGSATGGLIFEDNGTFWNYWDVDQPVYAMETYSDSVVWAVGDSGYVVVNVLPSMLSIEQEVTNENFEIYPNPFESIVNLDLDGFVNPTLMIFDAQVRIVEQKVISTSQQDLSFLEKGIYVFVLTDGESKRMTRVIKH
ncbi:MAG: photosystem II stability/assembly factor-like uncharacterized protein [Arenicella sp.]|jgi:photosystem II stability/assembly factor-like uncharacterized protein